jgi:hypothetical protein
MKNSLLVLGILVLCISYISAAQEQTVPPDGPPHTFQDNLLDKMAGHWKLTGTIRGQSAEHLVDAQWMLNHQFLQVHEKDTAAPKGTAPAYEANVMIGYDSASERYVAHWIDVFGGRVSETLGYGTRSGDQIEFVFEYPDGPFHTTFRWRPDKKQWQWQMRTKNSSGKWVDFANLTLTPAP